MGNISVSIFAEADTEVRVIPVDPQVTSSLYLKVGDCDIFIRDQAALDKLRDALTSPAVIAWERRVPEPREGADIDTVECPTCDKVFVGEEFEDTPPVRPRREEEEIAYHDHYAGAHR